MVDKIADPWGFEMCQHAQFQQTGVAIVECLPISQQINRPGVAIFADVNEPPIGACGDYVMVFYLRPIKLLLLLR